MSLEVGAPSAETAAAPWREAKIAISAEADRRREPRALRSTIDKPGRRWSPSRRLQVERWIRAPAQAAYAASFPPTRLVGALPGEDGAALWRRFLGARLRHLVTRYDPDLGPRFFRFVFKEWLSTQWSAFLASAGAALRRWLLAADDEAADLVQSFFEERVDDVLDRYDPGRGGFWTLLHLASEQHAGRRAAILWRHTHGLIALAPADGGAPVPVIAALTTRPPLEDLALASLLAGRLSGHERATLHRGCFGPGRLSSTEKVRLWRARRAWLRPDRTQSGAGARP